MKYNNIIIGVICLFLVNVLQAQSTRVDTILHILKNPNDPQVLVCAHRGDWRYAPENSLLAIQHCIEMGVDIVEIDLQLSKDSIIVLMHDETLNRTSTGKGKISDYTYEELKKFRIRDGLGRATPYSIPTLEEAMLMAKGKILVNLDKAEAFLPVVFPILKKTGTVDHVIVGAYLSLAAMQQSAGVVLDSLLFMPKVNEATLNISSYLNEYEQYLDFKVIQVRLETEASKLLPNLKKWRADYGSWIWVNTISADRSANHDDEHALDDPEGNYGWLTTKGINIIQTDRPQLLLDYLRKKGFHK